MGHICIINIYMYISQKVAICSLWTVCPCFFLSLVTINFRHENFFETFNSSKFNIIRINAKANKSGVNHLTLSDGMRLKIGFYKKK